MNRLKPQGQRADLNATRKRLLDAQADSALLLQQFGDDLAKEEGYGGLIGLDAVHLFLIRKYGWMPAAVRAMSAEDLWFVLTVEMKSWKPGK